MEWYFETMSRSSTSSNFHPQVLASIDGSCLTQLWLWWFLISTIHYTSLVGILLQGCGFFYVLFYLEILMSLVILQNISGANHLELLQTTQFNDAALNKTVFTSFGSHISGVPRSPTVITKLQILGFSCPPQVWQLLQWLIELRKMLCDYSCDYKGFRSGPAKRREHFLLISSQWHLFGARSYPELGNGGTS